MIEILTDKTWKILDKSNSDTLKLIAAIMVMLGHYCTNLGKYAGIPFAGELWVGVFFFFSGYGTAYRANTDRNYLKGYLKKKIYGIWFPYMIANTVYILAEYILKLKRLNVCELIFSLLGCHLENSSLWYIIEVMVMYFAFWIALKFNVSKKYFFWFSLYFIFLIFAVAIDMGTWWFVSTSAFLGGVFVANDSRWFSILERRLRITVLGLFIIGYIAYKFIQISEWVPEGIPFLTVNYAVVGFQIVLVPLFIFVLTILFQCSPVNIHFKYVPTDLSYSIYLIHMAVYLVIDTVMGFGWITIVPAVALTIMLSYIWMWIKNKLIC